MERGGADSCGSNEGAESVGGKSSSFGGALEVCEGGWRGEGEEGRMEGACEGLGKEVGDVWGCTAANSFLVSVDPETKSI